MPTFFVVLISIYLAGNIYIFRRGAQALVAQPFGVKVLLAVLFWCGALAFIGSFLARNTKLPVVLAHTAHEIGTGWLVFTLYMVLCLTILDLLVKGLIVGVVVSAPLGPVGVLWVQCK